MHVRPFEAGKPSALLLVLWPSSLAAIGTARRRLFVEARVGGRLSQVVAQGNLQKMMGPTRIVTRVKPFQRAVPVTPCHGRAIRDPHPHPRIHVVVLFYLCLSRDALRALDTLDQT